MNEHAGIARYSVAEEIAHSITHGLGFVASVAGLAVLVVLASLRGDAWHIVSCSIYGATLVLLYAASTLYHAVPAPRAKNVLRNVDHAAIYLLIAGTYTPFTLVTLRGGWGWSLFGVVWALALVGVLRETSIKQRTVLVPLLLYLGLGWLAVIGAKPLLASAPLGALGLIALGGLAYTVGVVFYCWGRLPYNHAIWHLFVLAGSSFHFYAVLNYVIPATI